MLDLAGFHFDECLHDSHRAVVYRGWRQADPLPVIAKVLKPFYSSPVDLERFARQYHLAKALSLPGVIRHYALESVGHGQALIMEDFGAVTLSDYCHHHLSGIKACLELAIAVTSILEDLHRYHIIHQRIQPQNILINPDTQEIKIGDFSLAVRAPQDIPAASDLDQIEDGLAYCSPEQTGRMHRMIDHRTDFYSLGVTFYEMLTGQLPFQGRDALEWVHCHLAVNPAPMVGRQADIPEALEDIVKKLMAKNAEDRYQSAYGLAQDLVFALQQWEQTGWIEPFPLGQHDYAARLQWPDNLYGRDRECDLLRMGFEQVCEGTTKWALISGFSGIGKSSLIDALSPCVNERHGYLVSGKFDQFQHDIPYGPLIQAFRGLLKQVFTESNQQIDAWRDKLFSELGDNGQVLIDIIPEVEHIIGPQPRAAVLEAEQNRNRFHLVFESFVHVFAQPEHPLVMFLDDMQWADGASISLIKTLLRSTRMGALYVIGAYRDHEVPPGHPLDRALYDVEQSGMRPIRIQVPPLMEADVVNLLADMLQAAVDTVRPLAALMMQRTGGNPLFLNAFLTSLYAEGMIAFDHETHRWGWDTAQIRQHEMAETVVDLMADKIQRLSRDAQKAVEVAACIGHRFTLSMLADVLASSAEAVYDHLYEAIAEGLIVPLSTMGRVKAERIDELACVFVHDRIRQAAYSLVSETEQPLLHRRIGELMMVQLRAAEPGEQLFDLVNHLNLGADRRGGGESNGDPGLSGDLRLADWNRRAAQKALKSTAYDAALHYASQGLWRLPQDAWQSHYELTLTLYVAIVEAAYLCGDDEAMQRNSQIALSQAMTPLDKMPIYLSLIQAHKSQMQSREAVAVGLEALSLLGIRFPKDVTEADEERAFQDLQHALVGTPVADLARLPMMSDPEAITAMQMLSKVITAAWSCHPSLHVLLMLKRVKMLLDHGNMAISAATYAAYAEYVCQKGEIDLGYQFGRLADQMLQMYRDPAFEARSMFMVQFFSRHWKEPIADMLPGFEKSYQRGLNAGDIEFAAFSAAEYCRVGFYAGANLSQLSPKLYTYINEIKRLNQKNVYITTTSYLQMVNHLVNPINDPKCLISLGFNEADDLSLYKAQGEVAALRHYYSCRLFLYYLFGEYEFALSLVCTRHDFDISNHGHYIRPWIVYLNALTRLANYPVTSPEAQEALLIDVDQDLQQLDTFASYSPINYLHKYHLVKAERLCVMGKTDEARGIYEKAIAGAKDHGFIHEEAIARELTGRFYLAIEQEELAAFYLQGAYQAFAAWGAVSKCHQLARHYPNWLYHVHGPVTSSRDHEAPRQDDLIDTAASAPLAAMGAANARQLDYNSIIKALQTLSSELDVDNLLRAMMGIIIENAGAQTGLLILPRHGDWVVAAIGRVEMPQVDVSQAIPIDEYPAVATAIVRYVVRTGADVVLHHAFQDSPFVDDPYLRACKPKSVLCTPIRHQDQLTGILYLENHLTYHAFTQERVEVLNLLLTQSAISLKNAFLYDRLNEEIAERQHLISELEAKNGEMEQFNYTVSHDLKSPLITIQGFLDILEQDAASGDTDQLNRDIYYIRDAAQSMEQLLKELLELSRIGRVVNPPITVDMGALVRETVERLASQINDAGVQLDIVSDLSTVFGDRLRLLQVMQNLLENAIKFMGDQPSPRIEIGLRDEGEQLVYYVSDNGIGIAPTYHDKVFGLFEKLDASSGGTGIGLALVKRIIEVHNGRIWIESTGIENGSAFCFTLPKPIQAEPID